MTTLSQLKCGDYNPTAEEIAAAVEHLDGIASIRAINSIYREMDESHLWPILDRFNVTERAIRKVRALRRDCPTDDGLAYCYTLEAEMSEIVNGEY